MRLFFRGRFLWRYYNRFCLFRLLRARLLFWLHRLLACAALCAGLCVGAFSWVVYGHGWALLIEGICNGCGDGFIVE